MVDLRIARFARRILLEIEGVFAMDREEIKHEKDPKNQ
jgi:hypothetical protein